MTKQKLFWLSAVCLLGSLSAGDNFLFARGGGGGFHGGGGLGGYHGGGGYGGGFHGGDFGGYHGGDHFGGYGGYGGDRVGGYGGYGGDRVGGYGADRYGGGYRAGGLDNFARPGAFNNVRPETIHPATSNLGYGEHRALPGDWGMSRVAGDRGYGYLNRGNFTRPVTSNWANNRGNDVRRNFNQFNYFNRGWYGNHPGAWYAAGWRHGYYWGAATWPFLGGWFGWGGGISPYYYDYGNSIVYQGDEVYQDGQPIASADDYYQQASDLAAAGQSDTDQAVTVSQPASSDNWTPLGVFSLVQGEQSDTSALFQLAVSKSGQIAGNYSDVLTGGSLQVHGSVDQKTQRAAWTVGDNKTTVYETGIYNLTKDQTPVLIHFGKDRTQQWLLVRMKQPESAEEPKPEGE